MHLDCMMKGYRVLSMSSTSYSRRMLPTTPSPMLPRNSSPTSKVQEPPPRCRRKGYAPRHFDVESSMKKGDSSHYLTKDWMIWICECIRTNLGQYLRSPLAELARCADTLIKIADQSSGVSGSSKDSPLRSTIKLHKSYADTVMTSEDSNQRKLSEVLPRT